MAKLWLSDQNIRLRGKIMRHVLFSAAGVLMLLAGLAPAQAQDVRHHRVAAVVSTQAPPLTVNRRSWLDMGTAANVGTQDSNLSASTTLNEPIYASYLQDSFGRSTLPRRFSLPFNENPRGQESGGIFFDF